MARPVKFPSWSTQSLVVPFIKIKNMEGSILLGERYIEFNFEDVAFKILLETFISNYQSLQKASFQYSNT